MAIHQLVYISRAACLMTKEKLQSILHEARQFNADHGITGLLLYKDQSFMQFLEGNKPEVRDLYERICKDRRHFKVTKITDSDSESRDFDNWAMAYLDLSTGSKLELGQKPFDLSTVYAEVAKTRRTRELIRFFMENA